MKERILFLLLILIFSVSCRTGYKITDIKATKVEIDSTFDKDADPSMQYFVDSYKKTLIDEMGQKLGISAIYMDYGRPESLLTNFTSDVMKEYGDEQVEQGCDFAVMNVNGHRSTLPQGEITLSNLFEIYPFENAIVFLKLRGDAVIELFDSYAKIGGAGISSNVSLVIDKKKVKNITIDGKPIDDNKIYNITTIDYLAEGNNDMEALKKSVEVHETGLNLRDLMIDYVKQKTLRGEELNSKLDGRIRIENN